MLCLSVSSTVRLPFFLRLITGEFVMNLSKKEQTWRRIMLYVRGPVPLFPRTSLLSDSGATSTYLIQLSLQGDPILLRVLQTTACHPKRVNNMGLGIKTLRSIRLPQLLSTMLSTWTTYSILFWVLSVTCLVSCIPYHSHSTSAVPSRTTLQSCYHFNFILY